MPTDCLPHINIEEIARVRYRGLFKGSNYYMDFGSMFQLKYMESGSKYPYSPNFGIESKMQANVHFHFSALLGFDI